MRVGQLVSLPDEYSRFARIHDEYGVSYTVDPSHIPEDADMDKDYSYRVEIWGNDSGLAYDLAED